MTPYSRYTTFELNQVYGQELPEVKANNIDETMNAMSVLPKNSCRKFLHF